MYIIDSQVPMYVYIHIIFIFEKYLIPQINVSHKLLKPVIKH